MRSPTRLFFALVSFGALTGCPETDCPGDDVAVRGACYPAEAVAQVDGGVPTLCEPACATDQRCDYASGTCGECAVDAHCADRTNPACDPVLHACGPCTSDADCAGRPDAPYCDVLLGACGACTPENESVTCGAFACDVLAGRCSSTLRGTKGACESCRADSECGSAMRCVAFSFYGHAPEQVCLFDRSAVVCAATPTSPIAPYVQPAVVSTLRGETVEVCEPASSCGALRDYAASKPCQSATDCAGPPGASVCPGVGQARPGVCTIWCATVASGYEGCYDGDYCNGTFCEPAF